jgi:hypothetical protein
MKQAMDNNIVKLIHKSTNTHRYGKVIKIEDNIMYYNCYIKGVPTKLSSIIDGNINYEILPSNTDLKLCKNS